MDIYNRLMCGIIGLAIVEEVTKDTAIKINLISMYIWL